MRSNERKKLIREIEKAGYECRLSKNSHWKVTIGERRRIELVKEGFDLSNAPAFVTMSASPSDFYSERRARKDMRLLGYFREGRR